MNPFPIVVAGTVVATAIAGVGQAEESAMITASGPTGRASGRSWIPMSSRCTSTRLPTARSSWRSSRRSGISKAFRSKRRASRTRRLTTSSTSPTERLFASTSRTEDNLGEGLYIRCDRRQRQSRRLMFIPTLVRQHQPPDIGIFALRPCGAPSDRSERVYG